MNPTAFHRHSNGESADSVRTTSFRRSRFWRELCLNAKFKVDCSEYLVLAELAFVMVPGSVEDERLFSAMNFIKNDLRNRLKNPHLTATVRLFFSRQLNGEDFPLHGGVEGCRCKAGPVHWHLAQVITYTP